MRRSLLGLGVTVLILGPGVFHLAYLSWKRHALERKQRTLEAEHHQLAKEQERLTTDSTYVEGLIRSTFKLAKPGEIVVPLQEDRATTAR